jgi:electron transfer flavoprotein alpha subunit
MATIASVTAPDGHGKAWCKKRLAADNSRTGEIIKSGPATPMTSKTRLLEVIEEAGHKINISEAEVIVAGGRGMGNEKGFALLKELADA